MISSTFDKHHHHRHRYHDDGSYDHHHQKSEIPLQIHVIAVTDDDANHTVFNDIMLLVYINLHQFEKFVAEAEVLRLLDKQYHCYSYIYASSLCLVINFTKRSDYEECCK